MQSAPQPIPKKPPLHYGLIIHLKFKSNKSSSHFTILVLCCIIIYRLLVVLLQIGIKMEVIPPPPYLGVYPMSWLIDQVGLKVILIEELTPKDRFGLLAGVVVESDDKNVLCVKEMRTRNLHRFQLLDDVRVSEDRYFIEWSLWRHLTYVTSIARELRRQTEALYLLALRTEIICPEDRQKMKQASNRELREYISGCLRMPADSHYDAIANRLKGL